MNIIYISSACHIRNKEEIDITAKRRLEYSGIKFHNLLIKGLKKNGVSITSIIGLPISITTNKKIIWKRKKDIEDDINYIQLPFINIPILKQFTIGINLIKEMKKIIKNDKKDIRIIVDGAYISILPFLKQVIKKYKVKTYFIFADIYSYMADVENGTQKKIINKYIKKYVKKIYENASGYIFLTEQMNKLINHHKKPFVIIEGLVDFQDNYLNQNKIEKKNSIMYAGKLSEKFGIKKMIEAFDKIEDEHIELWIYGFGEMKNYVESISKKNSRIKFFGEVSNEIILQKEKQTKILINPRPTNEEYTKYSFPSKNMEYMLSGTPLITTKLPGMPEEYYKYVYLIENEDIDGIKNTIEITIKKSEDELLKKGMSARKFVLNKKNNYIQAKKILEMMDIQ